MYKLLIAEDEAIIRNGIARAIDWPRLGFEVCGVAEDGLEALEMIRRLEPEVLVTDIKMPGMTGLELMHALNEENRHIQTVILTGYADFGYAREAIKERAFGYVLKMDVMEELSPLMARLKAEMDRLRRPVPEEQLAAIRENTVKSTQAILDGLRGEPIEQAVEYVLGHFAERLRMEEVAKRFFMSPAYFSRTFKQKTGEGFSEMVTRLRMQWAKSILENSSMRVADVARAAGYTDLKYFTGQFRRAFGKTPSQCREGREKRTGP